jgi:hypothetical protein
VHPDAHHIAPLFCDNDVDIGDVQRVASCWSEAVGPACPTPLDFNGTGDIDIGDVIIVAGEWGWPDF